MLGAVRQTRSNGVQATSRQAQRRGADEYDRIGDEERGCWSAGSASEDDHRRERGRGHTWRSAEHDDAGKTGDTHSQAQRYDRGGACAMSKQPDRRHGDECDRQQGPERALDSIECRFDEPRRQKHQGREQRNSTEPGLRRYLVCHQSCFIHPLLGALALGSSVVGKCKFGVNCTHFEVGTPALRSIGLQ